MNIDSKLEAEKIARELVSGTVDQACEDYKNILGNYHYLTSSRIEKSFLKDLGTHIAKHARKKPDNFLLFCKKVWISAIKDGRAPVGLILANLEIFDPKRIIPEIIERAPSPDTWSFQVSDEEFYFRIPYEILDLLLFAWEYNVPTERICEVMGLTAEQVKRAMRDFNAKYNATRHLRQLPPTLE